MLEGILHGPTDDVLAKLHTNLQTCIEHDDLALPILPSAMWQLLTLHDAVDAVKLSDSIRIPII